MVLSFHLVIPDLIRDPVIILSFRPPSLSFRAVTRNPEKCKGQTKFVWFFTFLDSGSEAGMTKREGLECLGPGLEAGMTKRQPGMTKENVMKNAPPREEVGRLAGKLPVI